ncbi:hypothetical protein AVEN_146814-1 [Araneus ventricosus]|uniref:THAP-type domain-containing protein n=1 Tax=Araneus ventricosus TaxID=182803 RepID=A0A4Y2W5B4_ARAVE|nr:hypothetical protein AVEN_146814-1 [Araneus ventricosus]
MPNTCCVTNCRGNYDAENKVAVFSFPKVEELKLKWIQAIPRRDLVVTKNTKVCEKHFTDDDIERVSTFYKESTGETLIAKLKKPRLKEGATPKIFPHCPSYLSSTKVARDGPEVRKLNLEEQHLHKAIADSLLTKEQYDNKFSFQNFVEMQNCFTINEVPPFWSIIHKDKHIIFLSLVITDCVPCITYAITINDVLQLSISYKGQNLSKHKDTKLPIKVSNFNQVLDILKNYETNVINYDNPLDDNLYFVTSSLKKSMNLVEDKFKFLIEFFIEQLHLLKLNPVRYRYSSNMLIFSSLLFHISPQAYKFMRHSGNLILPDPSTIRKVSSMLRSSPVYEQQDKYFLSYAKQIFSKISDGDHNVFLLLDEIHMKPFMDYKGGNIVGNSYDNANLATSAHVFMLNSISSSFKDVVHIVPVSHIVAEDLFTLLKKIILALEEIGFKVMGIVTDNNSINRKAVSNFNNPPQFQVQYQHPADEKRPLFYLIDSVHLIKCVRNNWINQKNGYFMYYPQFEGEENSVQTASFSVLRKLYDIESSELLKFGIGLTRKALWPTNLERQNVSLALKIFSSNLVKGLLELGEKHSLMHYGDTANFLNIFCTWWDIANVKTVTKGKHKNNPMAEPITDSLNDIKKEFLKKFIAWLDKYEKMDSNNGRFSRETHSALRQTSQAFLSVTEYCCNNLNMSYLLLGKIQTDKLESRLRQYRSMSGDQYHISIRQLYETENKLRISRELKLISHTSGSFDIDLFDNCDQDENSVEIIDDFFQDIEVSNSDIDKVADSLPVITYLAGYCSHSAHKNVKCYKCRKKLLTDKEMDVDNFKLIKSCDRGGLLYPSEFVTNIVLHIYIVTQKLISEKYELQFLKVQNQRNLVMKLVEELLMSKDMWDFSVCSSGYTFEKVIAKIMKSATNTLLNNYCKIKNDKQKGSKTKKKRKLETLSEIKNTSSLLEKKTKTNTK